MKATRLKPNIMKTTTTITEMAQHKIMDCPDCDGGKLNISQCCNAELISGICLDCMDHSDGEDCEKCIGTGKVEADRPDDLF